MKKDGLFDFDTLVEQRDTASLKWEKYKGRDIIPLWVARGQIFEFGSGKAEDPISTKSI